ncbi:MAG: tRNA pseudouridine(55) synthase TruB, partial [Acholeplasmatales bacterium]|nr:tRNA pseudouridine(55) synthase TruB [Acholeplasmatales bacterium]
MFDGVILLDKKPGASSNYFLGQLKKKLSLPRGFKVGHTGTLDPFASGLLVCLLGKATKLAPFFPSDKAYQATLKLGFCTDSLDITGNVLQHQVVKATLADLKAAADLLVKNDLQDIPAFSAKKNQGVKMYQLAHKALPTPLMQKKIAIYELSLTAFENDELDFYTHCSSGTYIRQIGSDLAQLTHNLGTISVLRRLRVGDFKVENAQPLEEITLSNLIPITALFADLPHLS